MSLKATFTLNSIKAFQKQKEQEFYNHVLNAFVDAGNTFCEDARKKKTFKNFTGNLESSIGYVLIYNGKQVAINFSYAGSGTDKETGLQTGIQLAELISKDYPKGFALICVAGMYYALSVEANNKIVISEATIDLSKNIKKLLEAK